MPNHVHGIIIFKDVGAGLRPAQGAGLGRAGFKPAPTKRHPLSETVRAFKSFSTRRIHEFRGTLGIPVWQRNYYERVIRDDEELHHIREYIVGNPAQWAADSENPAVFPRPTEPPPWYGPATSSQNPP